MSFPRYPRYKDSGVEWLGKVPEHWAPGRLRYVSDIIVDGTHHSPDSYLEGEYLYITAKNIKEHGFDLTEITYVTAAAHQQIYPRCSVQKNDVLYIKDGATAGIAMVNALVEEFSLLSSVAVIRPAKSFLLPHFVSYHLNAGQFKTDALNRLVGGAMTRFTLDMISRFVFAIPPLEEQAHITAFLDSETAKIDELVAEQHRLMELLKEKRQAVISHAVTRGLNYNAGMQPSGIAWLGSIPADWEVPLFGRLISKAELGENYDSAEGNEGVPVMKMGNLDRGSIKLHKVEYLPEGIGISESMALKEGDFLFNTRNSLDLVGKVAIWRGEISNATYNSNILRVTFNSLKVATSAFMNYFFNSDLGLSQLRSLAKGTTSVAAIYYKDLTALRVMLPPPAEQQAIVTHLDNACLELDTLTAEAQRAIDLLQERRSALISAAVTGQIDVRQLAEKQAA